MGGVISVYKKQKKYFVMLLFLNIFAPGICLKKTGKGKNASKAQSQATH